MEISLKHFERHMDGSPGDHLVATIQQLGEEKSATDTTKIIADTSPDHRDIRIVDGNRVIKLTLDDAYELDTVYEDDVVIDRVHEP